MGLTRDQILQAQDLPKEEVQVQEWGGSVWVRGLTASERDQMESYFFDDAGKRRDIKSLFKNMRARLVVWAVCDESGNSIFTEKDIEQLGKKNGKVVDRLYGVIQRLSGLTKQDIEELSKNSESGQPEDSPSVLPAS